MDRSTGGEREVKYRRDKERQREGQRGNCERNHSQLNFSKQV
jgi:hypothetical protein